MGKALNGIVKGMESVMEFQEFGKIARLTRECTITMGGKMQIEAKDISGFLQIKRDLKTPDGIYGFKQALDLLSKKKLEVVIDREKLAKYMADDDKNWDTDDQFRNYWLDRADIVLQRAKTDNGLVKIVCGKE